MGTASLIFGAASLLVGLCTCGLCGWLALILGMILWFWIYPMVRSIGITG